MPLIQTAPEHKKILIILLYPGTGGVCLDTEESRHALAVHRVLCTLCLSEMIFKLKQTSK